MSKPEAAAPMIRAAAPSSAGSPTITAELREPTPAEKRAIRAALDANFDEDKGAYLTGWSDQRVGETCNLPWRMVEKLRESAYGPLRVDPVIVAVQAELAALKASNEKLLGELAKASDQAAALEAKLDAYLAAKPARAA